MNYFFRSICYWTWSRAFLILITLVALGLSIYQYLEFNVSIAPLPLVGCIVNSIFILVILLGTPCLVKFYTGLFVLYALALIILVTSSQASINLIDFPVSRVHNHSDDALTISVKALLLVGLSWFLVAGQVIGSMLYLKDLKDYTSGFTSRLFLDDSYLKPSLHAASFSGSLRDSPL
ncbi:uncharacterized protein LOC107368453 [Tetranychus urticae]|uniref:Uncharacterized protein n=1 Tax=Tetranychus urticae TaxID=32264 RepID=T1KI50_TETUR|nr:uncharacterized protein LOC107364461 [Tetranychus urticae]XP_015791757.1 uncharacterized protein LOC107368453 [Tetranychus urticae]